MDSNPIAPDKAAQAIAASQPYKQLVASRRRLQWGLTGVMLVAYYGFILLVAFGKQTLATRFDGSVITYAIPVGLAVASLCVITTGYYVWQANVKLDALSQSIRQEGSR